MFDKALQDESYPTFCLFFENVLCERTHTKAYIELYCQNNCLTQKFYVNSPLLSDNSRMWGNGKLLSNTNYKYRSTQHKIIILYVKF